MDDFTRISPSPRRETLAFIRAFARFYSPQQHNEADARRCADRKSTRLNSSHRL